VATDSNETLHFEFDPDQLTLGQLMRIEGQLSAVIRSVAADVAHERDAVGWVVDSIRSGSPIAYALRAIPRNERIARASLSETVRAIVDGFGTLEKGSERPAHFPDEAVENASYLADALGKQVRSIRVWAGGKINQAAVEITKAVVAHADALLRQEVVSSLGTVEGRLEALSIHGKMYFNVYDDLTNDRIECLFAQSDIAAEDIGAAIGKRVAVFGTLIHRDDGKLIKATAEDLEIFPDPDRLPTVDDVAGILA